MNQNIALFFQKVATEADLQAKVRAVSDLEGVASLARAEGFSFDVEELEEAACLALSDEQLEEIAGGAGAEGSGVTSMDEANRRVAEIVRQSAQIVEAIRKMEQMEDPLESARRIAKRNGL